METQTAWLERFNDAISNFSEEIFLPRDLFLLQTGPYTNLFESFLKSARSSQYTVTAEPFNIVTVDNSLSHTFALYKPEVVPDTALGLEANFLTRFYFEDKALREKF
jgi:hypothetical protein